MKLQMHALEVGNQLEETSTQALAAIPRVLREVERLRKDVRGSVGRCLRGQPPVPSFASFPLPDARTEREAQ